MLRWRRTSKWSKDLMLTNPEEFDTEEFVRRLKTFAGNAEPGRWIQDLVLWLKDPGNMCLSYETGHRRGIEWAQAVWKCLFGTTIPGFRQPVRYQNGRRGYEDDEDAWGRWYVQISDAGAE